MSHFLNWELGYGLLEDMRIIRSDRLKSGFKGGLKV